MFFFSFLISEKKEKKKLKKNPRQIKIETHPQADILFSGTMEMIYFLKIR